MVHHESPLNDSLKEMMRQSHRFHHFLMLCDSGHQGGCNSIIFVLYHCQDSGDSRYFFFFLPFVGSNGRSRLSSYLFLQRLSFCRVNHMDDGHPMMPDVISTPNTIVILVGNQPRVLSVANPPRFL